jgi:hypothetical protein
MSVARLIVRWTVGDVSAEGFESLGFSIRGAWRMFGDAALYTVCVNTIDPATAKALAGPVPCRVTWRAVDRGEMPPFLRPHFDHELAEGVGWKFMPLRLCRELPELALDNDCIIWEPPEAFSRWLDGDSERTILAEDVRPCFGRFADICGAAPRNSGIRGLPAGFDFAGRLRHLLDERPGLLTSELDEQGLQVAAVSAGTDPLVVTADEVAICSPFPPHRPAPGTCGVHFVGLNARQLPWNYYGRPASDCVRENWTRFRDSIAERVNAA